MKKGFKRRGIKFCGYFLFSSACNIKRHSLINKIRGGSRNKRNVTVCDIYIYFGSMNMNIVKSGIFDSDAK